MLHSKNERLHHRKQSKARSFLPVGARRSQPPFLAPRLPLEEPKQCVRQKDSFAARRVRSDLAGVREDQTRLGHERTRCT